MHKIRIVRSATAYKHYNDGILSNKFDFNYDITTEPIDGASRRFADVKINLNSTASFTSMFMELNEMKKISSDPDYFEEDDRIYALVVYLI